MIISSKARRAAQKQLKLAAQWAAFFVLGTFAVILAAMMGEGLALHPVQKEALFGLMGIGIGLVAVISAIGWLCSVIED